MLGEKLKALRQQSNKTQQQIADKLGITRAAYSHFENDRNQPDSATIVKLSEIFEVSTDYLLGRNDNSQKKDPTLIAAHLDDDLSEEQMDEVQKFIAFIKQRDHGGK